MTTQTIAAVGGAAGIVLPQEALDRLGVKLGDELLLLATEEGIILKPCDPSIQHQLDVAKRVMKKRQDVLRRLAE